jgi:hypothetical protein
VPHAEQELLTFPEHLRPPQVSCCLIISFLCNVLQIDVCSFVLFLLAIELSVLLRFTDSDYPFGILKLFLYCNGETDLITETWRKFHVN